MNLAVPGESVLIDRKSAAENLEIFSLMMGAEAQDLLNACRKLSLEPPYAIPQGASPSSSKETPWFLDGNGATNGEPIRKITLFSTSPRRTVFMDFSDTARSVYGFRFESEEAVVSQAIAIRTQSSDVETEPFVFRIGAENFANAIRMALSIATVIYTCGQYKVTEIAGFGLRLLSEDKVTPLAPRVKKPFSLPRPLPVQGEPLAIVTSASLPEDAKGRRLPVASIRLSPRDTGRWNADVVLRRPPSRAGLMPLHPRLMKVLWAPIFSRIFSVKRLSSPPSAFQP